MKAPTGRKISVSVTAIETEAMFVENSMAMSRSTKTSRKKSKASSDQPRYAAMTTLLCSRVQSEKTPFFMIVAPAALRESVPFLAKMEQRVKGGEVLVQKMPFATPPTTTQRW